MKETKILVIDDSSTIRRLVDNELSAAGYVVLMSGTAEEGVACAAEQLPDLILLDHQLPGTTGFDVCCQLLKLEALKRIPIVISSTLRKKAYVEYVDAPNVVDMLPKPYTTELLLTTVENALNTASMVVQSQTEGSAVPETIGELAEADLVGAFDHFGLREVLDMLNSGSKCGVLEIQTDSFRVLVYLNRGRVQGVTASGLDPGEVARYMPESLQELAPVIKVSVAGRQSSAIDSLVELLDNKLLDPRLLKKLLRLQAAVLMRKSFTSSLKNFRFESGVDAPSLFCKLPLEISLVALLVEGASICPLEELPALEEPVQFSRRSIRGQNLDRAGLSSAQMKLMGLLAGGGTLADFCSKSNVGQEEVYRALCGFELAELVERKPVLSVTNAIAVTSDPAQISQLKLFFEEHSDLVSGKVVSDWLAVGLLMRRQPTDFLLVNPEAGYETKLQQLQRSTAFQQSAPRLVRIANSAAFEPQASEFSEAVFSELLSSPIDHEHLISLFTEIEAKTNHQAAMPLAIASPENGQHETPMIVEGK